MSDQVFDPRHEARLEQEEEARRFAAEALTREQEEEAAARPEDAEDGV